jgi:hypothetical protein
VDAKSSGSEERRNMVPMLTGNLGYDELSRDPSLASVPPKVM